MKNKLKPYVSDVLKNYFQKSKDIKRIVNNMYWARENFQQKPTTHDAFVFVLGSATSAYSELSINEQNDIVEEIWSMFVQRDFKITKLW